MKINDLSDTELLKEFHDWNNKIKTATRWGAALSVAYEFRRCTEIELLKRGIPIPGYFS